MISPETLLITFQVVLVGCGFGQQTGTVSGTMFQLVQAWMRLPTWNSMKAIEWGPGFALLDKDTIDGSRVSALWGSEKKVDR